MLHPPQARKLVFTTVDRAVSYYETNRGSFDLSGRVYASGGMGVPQSLTMVSNEAGGRGRGAQGQWAGGLGLGYTRIKTGRALWVWDNGPACRSNSLPSTHSSRPPSPPSLVGEQLVYGDSKGHVVMLLCGTREWPARDLISTEEHQDYIYIHQDHNDWVSQVGRVTRRVGTGWM